jgi:hypothetical protein
MKIRKRLYVNLKTRYVILIKVIMHEFRNRCYKEGCFLDTQRLMRRAFHLRKRIDALEGGQRKQQLIQDYVKIIWQIQNH